MLISNNFINSNFKGFKEFVLETNLSNSEKCFVDYLKDNTQKHTDKINGKEDFERTDKFIPAEELKNYNIIDVYGDIYRDEKNKNEVFLKLRIKPTWYGVEIIKNAAFDKEAQAELNREPFVTEFVSQPIAVRSKNAYSDIIKILDEKSDFFKKYLSGIAKWKTTTKNLLKSSNKPKFGWDKDLIKNMIYVSNL